MEKLISEQSVIEIIEKLKEKYNDDIRDNYNRDTFQVEFKSDAGEVTLTIEVKLPLNFIGIKKFMTIQSMYIYISAKEKGFLIKNHDMSKESFKKLYDEIYKIRIQNTDKARKDIIEKVILKKKNNINSIKTTIENN